MSAAMLILEIVGVLNGVTVLLADCWRREVAGRTHRHSKPQGASVSGATQVLDFGTLARPKGKCGDVPRCFWRWAGSVSIIERNPHHADE